MRGWLVLLVQWSRLPVRGGFAELDMQIDKLRMLRDSYKNASQDLLHDKIADVNKNRNLLLVK
jgi:hypothetical protein